MRYPPIKGKIAAKMGSPESNFFKNANGKWERKNPIVLKESPKSMDIRKTEKEPSEEYKHDYQKRVGRAYDD